jgi:uncharacterized protein
MTGFARAWITLALAGLVLLVAVGANAAPSFPKLSGRVVDEAHILPAPVVADLTAKLAGLETKTSRQLVVVTVPSLQGYEIADYGYQLGRAWGLGQKGLNNGALLVVAPTEHKVRIEVGYGLEGVVTDALSSVILQTQVLPKFKAGDMPGGVVAGADALVEQLSLDPSTAEQRLAAAASTSAQGGGSEHAPNPIVLMFVILFVFLMLRTIFRGRGGSWFAPIVWGGGSGFGGGGGGGGGGGFSGGGGSFGGGGSSGSW